MQLENSRHVQWRRAGSGRRAGQRFDADYGVTTEALLFLGELDPQAIGASLEFATHYEPTPVADFEGLLANQPLAPPLTTFLDVGSGMGRALMLAARRPFKHIVGIEISPALHEIAETNLRAFPRAGRACRDIRLVCGDALAAALPAGDLLVYLYNPFRSAAMARFIPRLAQHADAGHAVAIVYHTPVEHETIAAAGFEISTRLRCGNIYRRSVGGPPAGDIEHGAR